MGQSRLILIDTPVVLWLASDPRRISSKATAAIDSARRDARGVAICDITLLELSMLAAKERIEVSISLESFLAEIERRFVVLPLSARACARAAALPPSYPKDPADRIIGATALVEGLPLVTADREIRRMKLICTIW
jgi:PIN domain nuclease of toxin-antitoxin system